ncbi:MAG: hypothetical protein U9P79_01850 [Candidatus Cloacimonadota bacterium]|nr:hypothetical protein [Candidatus Cloacimonadota bacterium]
MDTFKVKNKERHYLLKVDNKSLRFGVQANIIKNFKDKFKDNFCIIFYRLELAHEAYIFPFYKVKHLFIEKYNELQWKGRKNRWTGSITNDCLHVSHCPEVFPAQDYHTFHFLDKNIAMPDDFDSKYSTVEPTDKSERKTYFRTLLRDSFNHTGVPEFDEDENYCNSNNRVKNLARRGSKLRKGHIRKIKNEPKPGQRRRKVERELLEGPDPKMRETLSQWYHGKCQICGSTWSKSNGEPYFVAAYLVERQNAAYMDTPANAICLCAEHFAQWRLAAKESPLDIVEQIEELRLPSEGGEDELSIVFTLLGQDCEIKYCEQHLLDLKELINAQADILCFENF